VYVNGGELTGPHEYKGIGANEALYTTLTVTRGPSGYKFPPIEVGLRHGTGCEVSASETQTEAEIYNHIDDEGKKWILFAQPCPMVHFAGDLF